MADRPRNLDDSALLELVQRQTFRYFWDFGHPVSGLSRDRNNGGPDEVTSGGTGFGIMAIIVAVKRGWVSRKDGLERLMTMLKFIAKAGSYHGVVPHFWNGATGQTIPFSRKDDGGDLVETSFLIAALLCARQFFDGKDQEEMRLRSRVSMLWNETEWDWHTRDSGNVLYWHWSPNNGWAMNHEVRGWNECLITYVMAASSPRYPIKPDVYHRGYCQGNDFRNGRTYYDLTLPLGPDYGGPLFFSHYSFLYLDPRGLKDRYADYWHQNVQHTLINREHCIRNPKGYKGYGADCWGLTASDNHQGYSAHAPHEDLGVITPTAALSSFPYTPDYSMQALRHFYGKLGDKIWGEYGFRDAFSETHNWVAESYLAIDQGPIIIMIENYRTGLFWDLFMSCPEVQEGLKKLGFESPRLRAGV